MTKEPCISAVSKNTYSQLVDKEMKHVCEHAVGGLVAKIKLKETTQKMSRGFFRSHFVTLLESFQSLQKILEKSRMMVTIQLHRKMKNKTKIISFVYRISVCKFIKLRCCDPNLSLPTQAKSNYFPFLHHVWSNVAQ